MKQTFLEGRNFPRDDVNNEILLKEYEEGDSLPYLAQKYGMTPRGIKLKIERYGGKTRAVGEEITRKLASAKAQGISLEEWVGFRTSYWQQVMSSKEYKAWREEVFQRDCFTCMRCGDKTGGNLNAHHILRKALYPQFMFEIRNGITLCEPCHDKTFHHEDKFVDEFFALIREERLE